MNKPGGEPIDLRPFFDALPSSMLDAFGITAALFIAAYIGYYAYHFLRLARPEQEEEKPKRKNDESESEPVPSTSHFELGDDGELIEVFDPDPQEKPKRRED